MHINTTGRAFFGLGTAMCGPLAAIVIAVGCGSPDPVSTSASSSGQGASGTSSSGEPGGSGGTGGTGTSSGGGGGGAWDPEAGWTVIDPAADTIKIYVSSSDGADANDGKSPEKAVKTIAKGKSLLRDMGAPDWLLLKRGDVWNEGIGTWTKSGRSEKEPMVISTYGDALERPLLKTGTQKAVFADKTATINHVAFIGLHFYANTRDPDSGDFVGSAGDEGFFWTAQGEDLLIEDMMIESYKGNVSVQGINGKVTNVRLRRSVIIDAYEIENPDPNVQLDNSAGLYAMNVTGLVIEGNVFDHNGWNSSPKVPGANPTNFNHNMYIQSSCAEVTIRDNITTRAASHGFQARAGGIVEGNLSVDNPIGFSFGLTNGAATPVPGGVTGHVSGNVVRDSDDITPAEQRGAGIQLGNIKSAVVEDNILAHDKTDGSNHVAFELTRKTSVIDPEEKIQNLKIQNNIVYDWRRGFRFSAPGLVNVQINQNDVQSPLRGIELVDFFQQNFNAGTSFNGNRWFSSEDAGKWFLTKNGPLSYAMWLTTSKEMGSSNAMVSYPDPERKLGTYHGSLGKEATFDAYIAEARKQSRKNYRFEYTAAGPIGYIRKGFGK